jgi:hypothetical protein
MTRPTPTQALCIAAVAAALVAARTREALAEWARLFAKVCEEMGEI